MTTFLSHVLLLCSLIFSTISEPFDDPDKFYHFGFIRNENPITFQQTEESQLPQNKLFAEELEESLDWRDYDGTNWMSFIHNQHLPNYCGACWAFSTTSALADRFMIYRGTTFPRITLSPQVLLDCDTTDAGCDGGDATYAHEYIRQNGITSESCSSYRAEGYEVSSLDITCNDEAICKTCSSDDGCSAVSSDTYQLYKILEHGMIDGEENMMKELTRGPIVCEMAVTEDFYYNYEKDEIYSEDGKSTKTTVSDIDHLVSIVGYGISDDNIKFWIVRNSWGTYFGDYGFFYIRRGENDLQIEHQCYWSVPDIDSLDKLGIYDWMNDDSSSSNNQLFSKNQNTVVGKPLIPKLGSKYEIDLEKLNDKDKHALPPVLVCCYGIMWYKRKDINDVNVEISSEDCCGLADYDDEHPEIPDVYKNGYSKISFKTSISELPTTFSWHNYNGINLLTSLFNQHIPEYCGSCWSFSVTAMLSDRISIYNYKNNNQLFPEINLSQQVLLNSGKAGSCSGGWPKYALKYIYEYGITDKTCQEYTAVSNQHPSDTELNICESCVIDSDSDDSDSDSTSSDDDDDDDSLWPGTCSQQTDNVNYYYIDEYGTLSGGDTDTMKTEIYENGPIVCTMYATDDFMAYETGIYYDTTTYKSTNHAVTIVGWGYDEALDTEYWIVKNSWGDYWGENGYFRIKLDGDNLNINKLCYYGSISFDSNSNTNKITKNIIKNQFILGLF